MELARRSDPKLTLKTYAKVGIHSLARVLDGMPTMAMHTVREVETLRATGTDPMFIHSSARTDGVGPQISPQSERETQKTGAASSGEHIHARCNASGGKHLRIAELGTAARSGAARSESAPRRTRTYDPLIKSQLLYQLS